MLTEQDGPVLFRSISLRSFFIVLSNCYRTVNMWRKDFVADWYGRI
jgi:hypothetical protein